MGTEYPKNREEAIRIVKSVIPRFYTFSGFETNVENYRGKYRPYLLKFLRHIRAENQGANRIFSLGDSEIERIVDATFPKRTIHSKVS